MYLFFDTETVGKPLRYGLPDSHIENWPRVVQVAWLRYNERRELLSQGNMIVKPDGFVIPPDATAKHGITTEYALEHGVPLDVVLDTFRPEFEAAQYIITHNNDFDRPVMGAEYVRKGRSLPFGEQHTWICTMRSTVTFCALPSPYGNRHKFPTLQELHKKLFGHEFENAHDAAPDVAADARCFFELKDLNIL